MPRALVNAGFDVVLLTPRHSLAEKSRFVAKIGHLPDNATPMQWVQAFAATVKATSPRLVMPCDDLSLRLLQMLALSPPDGMQPTLASQLGTLIRFSLGDASHYRASIDKTLLPAAAHALGIRVPPWTIVTGLREAEAFAAVHGYPMVIKRNYSNAGDGVEICGDRAGLARTVADLLQPAATDLEGQSGRLLAQAHVSGRTRFYPAMAWDGTLLTGYAAEMLQGNGEPKGPPMVNRYHRSPELRAIAVKLARGFGISGFFSPEFIEDDFTGVPYLLEINWRLVGGAHRGSAIGVDHAMALYAALGGTASSSRADLDEGEEHFTVHFPQEWLRDPQSRWLRDYPVDVPWDDPDLIEAMLADRHEE